MLELQQQKIEKQKLSHGNQTKIYLEKQNRIEQRSPESDTESNAQFEIVQLFIFTLN